MKVELVSHSEGNRRLIIIFAGWAMDANPFRHLSRPGYDIAVVWDYCSMHIDWSFTARYVEICIVAWSLGVYAASVTTYPIESKVTRRMAVNGTLFPVDNLRGIPPKTFAGTLDGLDSRSLHKFYRRVAGSREAFAAFSAVMPDRDIEELKDELLSFYPFPLLPCDPIGRCDTAIIGREDAIFPPVNQWRAWRHAPIEMVDAAHLVDMQTLLDSYIVDKSRVGERFERGRDTYQDAATAQADIIRRLWQTAVAGCADTITAPGASILEIGSGSGMLSRRICASIDPTATFEMWDICGDAPVDAPGTSFRRTDAETTISSLHADSLNVIASASTIQWFNSPTRFMLECRRVLRSGGVAVLSTFVRGNLDEVTQATGRSLRLLTPEQWRMIVPDGLEIVTLQSYDYTLSFDTPLEVFRHLKATGVNSLDRGVGHTSLTAALRRYPQSLDGRYSLTYRPLILILRKC